jgi:hypothetical protein
MGVGDAGNEQPAATPVQRELGAGRRHKSINVEVPLAGLEHQAALGLKGRAEPVRSTQ